MTKFAIVLVVVAFIYVSNADDSNNDDDSSTMTDMFTMPDMQWTMPSMPSMPDMSDMLDNMSTMKPMTPEDIKKMAAPKDGTYQGSASYVSSSIEEVDGKVTSSHNEGGTVINDNGNITSEHFGN